MTFALTVLGSGTVAPDAERAAPAFWVEADDVRLLLDCGAGALTRAAQFGIDWPHVTHVAVSHFHPDHWSELPSLLYALRWGTEPPRARPLTLLGPVGLRARLILLAGAYGEAVLDPGYPLEIVELAPGVAQELGPAVVLETCKTPHTSESLALAVRTPRARLVYTGDTGASDDLARWAADCDLLLVECSLPDERAIDVHLTPSRAGQLARAARARRVVLTHLYPAFGDADPGPRVAALVDVEVTVAQDGHRYRL